MDQSEETKDNTPVTGTGKQESGKTSTYDPDKYIPKQANEGDFEEGVPLASKEPEKGYSTDPGQGKQSASLHLADEDMDRKVEDPEAQAKDLKESFEMAKNNSDKSKE